MFDFSQAFQDDIFQPFIWEGNKKYCALLVHGFPGTPREMRPIAEILHSMGWTVNVLLLPGFGKEINSLADKTYAEWLSSVLNMIQRCKNEFDYVALIGFSMGGAISIQASVSSDIDGLLLLAPFWKIEHILWTMLPAIKLILPKFKPFKLFQPDFNDPDFRAGLNEWLPSVDLDDAETQNRIKDFAVPTTMINQVRIAGNHARQSVPHIKVPTTVIQGRQDELVKPELTQILVKYMTTDVNYITVDGDHDLTDTSKPHWQKVKAIIQQYALQFEEANR